MAPPRPPTPAPANEQWLAFRRKHDKELQGFQREVEKETLAFNRRLEATRANLLAKHAKEEEEFWRRQHAKTDAATAQKTDAKTADKPSSIPPKRSSTVPVARNRAQQQPSKSAVGGPKEPERSRASVMKPAQSRPAQKRKTTVPEVINLCSDDEDEEPVGSGKTSADTPARPREPHVASDSAIKATPNGQSPIPSAGVRQATPALSIPSANVEQVGSTTNKTWVSIFARPSLMLTIN